MPHRLPVDAGRLHRDMGTALANQPVRQREQLLGCRLEAAHLAPYRTVRHVPNAGHHRILVHVETGAMWVQNLHIPSPSCRCASGVGSRQTNSREPAPEPSPARGAIGGAPESWVQLTDGLLAPSTTRPLCRGAVPETINFAPVSSMAGRRSRWVTNRNRLAAAGERGGGKSAPRARGMEWPRAPAVVVSCREYRPGASRAGQRPRYAPLPHSSHPSRLRDRKFESIPLQQRESANFRFLTTSSNPVPPAKS